MWTETIAINGLSFRVEYERDDYAGAPWENCDGHGVVSDWERRNKRPGELILNEYRGLRRFYDFQESCRIARADHWDCEPYNDGSETKRQQAAKAARSDYEYLSKWCNDQWRYLSVDVQLLDEYGEPIAGACDSLCGVESFNDYHETVAREMCEEVLRKHKILKLKGD